MAPDGFSEVDVEFGGPERASPFQTSRYVDSSRATRSMPASRIPGLEHHNVPQSCQRQSCLIRLAVDAFMKTLKHPLADLVKALNQDGRSLRPTQASVKKSSGTPPPSFTPGAMKPFNPKEYRRYLVVFNFHRKDCIRLVFWHGDRANDKSGLLVGNYADGRRLALFSSAHDLAKRRKALVSALKSQLKQMAK